MMGGVQQFKNFVYLCVLGLYTYEAGADSDLIVAFSDECHVLSFRTPVDLYRTQLSINLISRKESAAMSSMMINPA